SESLAVYDTRPLFLLAFSTQHPCVVWPGETRAAWFFIFVGWAGLFLLGRQNIPVFVAGVLGKSEIARKK
ncbi:MAG: hypothetical protein KBH08_04140, partial [Brachymonas sp.]|nr:hypothetical protein [Brachymonas sp.]